MFLSEVSFSVCYESIRTFELSPHTHSQASSATDGLRLTLCPLSAGVLLWVPLSPGRHRLGGSALAQCYSQLGDCSPDLDRPELLTACFNTTQMLIHGQLTRKEKVYCD